MRGKGLPGFDEIMNAGITPAYAGKRNFANDIELELRITPAYAGKSHGVSSTSPMKWDHPRVCGEKT